MHNVSPFLISTNMKKNVLINRVFSLEYSLESNRTLILQGGKWIAVNTYLPLKKIVRKYKNATDVMYENVQEDLCTRYYSLQK
jgi:hypothetical protein